MPQLIATLRDTPADATAGDACCGTLTTDEAMGREQAEATAQLLKAVADPVRLQLLSLIRSSKDHKACVCDLTPAVGLSQPTVSHHLKVLTEAGLVTRERMAHDQRRVRVSLTARSRRTAQKLIPLIEQRYEGLEQALGLRSIQEVYDALDALLARTPRADVDA